MADTKLTKENIPEGWVKTILKEIIEINTSSIGRNFEYTKILYLDTGSITENRIDSLQEYSISDAPSRAKRLVKHQDIVYSTVRPNQRHFGFILNPKENLVVSTGFSVITARKEKACPKFLYYFLTQDYITQTLQQAAEHATSTYPSIKPEHIEILNIILPPLPEQQAISSTLSSFDDKIELLRRQNKTLEQIAQTIFKEWFGKYSTDRPDELPDEWRIDKVGNILETFLGGTPSKSKKEFWENGTVPWVNSGAVNNFRIIEGSELITKEALKKSATKLLPKGTVVLAITGATLGQYSRLEIDTCFNQSVVGIKERDNIHSSFVYFWLAENISSLTSHASGGAHQHINKDNINQTDIIIPCQENIDRFHLIADPIMEKISENMFQLQSLEKTRDTLLSKFMRGEVRVK